MKQDIKLIPFEELLESEQPDYSSFAKKYRINVVEPDHWFPVQLMAYLATYKFIPNGDEFLAHNLKSDRDNGLYRFIIEANRSDWITKQILHPLVCSITPTYMAAQKIYNNIPYNSWNITENLVPEALFLAMDIEVDKIELSLSDFSALRKKCLLWGNKPQNPATFHSVYHTNGTLLDGLPSLAKNMLLQTWCAHPNNRKDYMILDPWDWDNVPAPMIETDTILETEKPEPTKKVRRFGRKVSAS